MHLRMFEMAVDHVKQNMSDVYEVVGGYMSPVSDRYNKAGLASAAHRFVSHQAPTITTTICRAQWVKCILTNSTTTVFACASLHVNRLRTG